MALLLCVSVLSFVFLLLQIRDLKKQLIELRQQGLQNAQVLNRYVGLGSLVHSFNEVLADERQKTQRQFDQQEELQLQIRALSHDMRTPLTSILGYLELLESREEKREEYLGIIRQRALTLQDLIERFYELTLLEKLKENGQEQDIIHLRTFLETQVLAHHVEFEEVGLKPILELSDDLFIQANSEELQRIICNLMRNSLRYGRDFLQIRSFANGETVSLNFINRIGENQCFLPERLFDRFYVGDQSRQKGGTGLGLYIVKLLCERNQGHVEAKLDGDCLEILMCFPQLRTLKIEEAKH